jgi:hypothetical protein
MGGTKRDEEKDCWLCNLVEAVQRVGDQKLFLGDKMRL